MSTEVRQLNFRPYPWQQEVLRKLPLTKRAMLLAHRSAGKTSILTVYLVLTALTNQRSGLDYAWGGISYKQLRRTAWQEAKRVFLPTLGRDAFYEADLRIELPNGNRIHYLGLDSPELLRGLHLSGLVTDELQEFRREEISTTLFPMLNAHKGWWIGSGTAKGYDNALWDYWNVAENEPDADWLALKYRPDDTGLIDEERWRLIKATNNETEILQEYMCSFEASLEGRVYSKFQHSLHVGEVRDRGGDLYVGCDFNTSKMSWPVAQLSPDRQTLEVLGEILDYDLTTDVMAASLRRAYPDRIIYACPDASGTQRHAAASGTNLSILRQFGIHVLAPSRNPSIPDRINAVNMLLMNPSGETRVKIDPKAKDLIRTMAAHTYHPGTNLPRTDAGKNSYDAAGDAFGYLINMLFPIQRVSFEQIELEF